MGLRLGLDQGVHAGRPVVDKVKVSRNGKGGYELTACDGSVADLFKYPKVIHTLSWLLTMPNGATRWFKTKKEAVGYWRSQNMCGGK